MNFFDNLIKSNTAKMLQNFIETFGLISLNRCQYYSTRIL